MVSRKLIFYLQQDLEGWMMGYGYGWNWMDARKYCGQSTYLCTLHQNGHVITNAYDTEQHRGNADLNVKEIYNVLYSLNTTESLHLQLNRLRLYAG